MSYILDALRRAEAERERERSAVPGLHAQPLPAVPVDEPRPVPPALRMAVLLVAVLVVGAVASWVLRPRASSAPVAAMTRAVPEAAHATAVPEAVVAAAAVSPAPVAATRLPEPAPVVRAMPAPGPAPAPVAAPAPATAATASTVATAAAPAAPGRADPASLPPVPADLRLVPGGAIGSDTPSERMLILNGQLYHEGDHPAPDVTLERIGPRRAVLLVRGTRYQLSY